MAEREVRWTRTAQRDLNAIVSYIAEDSTENALAVLDRLQRRAETLSDNAERGRVLPELSVVDVHQYRELIERPWRLVYRIEPDAVLIMAVLDGRRDLRSVLLERLVRA
jgi:addiction module RelE/StbE family toxin